MRSKRKIKQVEEQLYHSMAIVVYYLHPFSISTYLRIYKYFFFFFHLHHHSPPTTIPAHGLPTSVEVAWKTTKTVTSESITTATTTITRYIQHMTISVPPLTTNAHGFHNWNITEANATQLVGTLWSSISLPPVTITDDPNPMNETGVSHPAVTCTVHPVGLQSSPPTQMYL